MGKLLLWDEEEGGLIVRALEHNIRQRPTIAIQSCEAQTGCYSSITPCPSARYHTRRPDTSRTSWLRLSGGTLHLREQSVETSDVRAAAETHQALHMYVHGTGDQLAIKPLSGQEGEHLPQATGSMPIEAHRNQWRTRNRQSRP